MVKKVKKVKRVMLVVIDVRVMVGLESVLIEVLKMLMLK